MRNKNFIRTLPLALSIALILLDLSYFYGLKFLYALYLSIAPLSAFFEYYGASLILIPAFLKIKSGNYRNFWEMVILRAVIPMIISSVFILPLIYIFSTFAGILAGHMNELEMIALTFLTVFLLHVLGLLRILIEVKNSDLLVFEPKRENLILIFALTIFAFAIFEPSLRIGDTLTTTARRDLDVFAFALRFLLSSIPSAFLAFFIYALLCWNHSRT